jgi:signal transduction histidine kinase
LENLLQWSRIQSNNIEYQPQNLKIVEIVSNSVSVFFLHANKKNITIQLYIDSRFYIFADYNMITTVVRNLISNAIKFTYRNGKIIISAKRENDFIEISIADSGIGIRFENIKKLFQIDQKFKTDGTAGEEGTGLGLILCKEFIEKNRGKIWAESVFGKGSTIKFTLPVAI